MGADEIVLTYIGTVLIAVEFIRKFTTLQALVGMLAAWPVSLFFGGGGQQDFHETYKRSSLSVILRVFLAALLCLVTLPLDIAFYVIWFIVLMLNSFHNWVNSVYLEGTKRYQPVIHIMIDFMWSTGRAPREKMSKKVYEQKMMSELGKGTIPILPLIGVILISIAFVLHFS